MVSDIEHIKNLERELRRVRNEFMMFYETTRALRTTLNLDEILYIILTSITSHQGLGFNRAALFFLDKGKGEIKGVMGIGPSEVEEAAGVWRWIQDSRKDLYDLINEYQRMKKENRKPKFFEMVENLRFKLSKDAGVLYEAFTEGLPLHIRKEKIHNLENDSLYKIFSFDEAVLVPLWAKKQVIAALFVDNLVTKKPITSQDINILNMFASQAGLAIENSRLFEDTLLKSHTDTLTGLWNYGYFQYKLDENINYSLRFNKKLCLLMLDIDGFKRYNDTFGHLEGDSALINIACLIKDKCRKEDLVCRYGGEEFSVILPNMEKRDALVIAERIRSSIESETRLFKRKVTVSIGISAFPEDCRDKHSLVSKADLCLYKSKEKGKNRVTAEE